MKSRVINKKRLNARKWARGLIAAVALTLLSHSAKAGDDAVMATIGQHHITQATVDEAVLEHVSKSQLYDLRQKAINQIIDSYLLNEEARRAHLTVDQYIDRETSVDVTEEMARAYYNVHRLQYALDWQGKSFDQLKLQIMGMMSEELTNERRAVLIAKLRGQSQITVKLQTLRLDEAANNHPSTGAENATVKLIEFSDYQCPYCRIAEATVKQLRQRYHDKVKFVFVDFPLGFHDRAMDAARAAACAGDQGKYWDYHDAIFTGPMKLSPQDLKHTAAELKLDQTKFNACFDQRIHDAQLQKDIALGQSMGLTGTPTFFLDDQELQGSQPLPKFVQALDTELARTATTNTRTASLR